MLAADFFHAPPLYSLRVAHLVDVIGLVTFAVVAATVGGLVDRLTRQGVQGARARAEAEDLARLAADMLIAPRPLEQAIASPPAAWSACGPVHPADVGVPPAA